MIYTQGTLLVSKGSGLPTYKKVQNKDWAWWEHLQFDQDKPLWKKDSDQLNRYGVKNTDEGMEKHYSDIFTFKTP